MATECGTWTIWDQPLMVVMLLGWQNLHEGPSCNTRLVGIKVSSFVAQASLRRCSHLTRHRATTHKTAIGFVTDAEVVSLADAAAVSFANPEAYPNRGWESFVLWPHTVSDLPSLNMFLTW